MYSQHANGNRRNPTTTARQHVHARVNRRHATSLRRSAVGDLVNPTVERTLLLLLHPASAGGRDVSYSVSDTSKRPTTAYRSLIVPCRGSAQAKCHDCCTGKRTAFILCSQLRRYCLHNESRSTVTATPQHARPRTSPPTRGRAANSRFRRQAACRRRRRRSGRHGKCDTGSRRTDA